MRPIRLLILPIVSLALGGCLQLPWSGELPAPETTASVAASRLAVASPPRTAREESTDAYRLDSGDRIRIVVSGQDSMSNSYEVDAAGAIDLPTIGKMRVRGLGTAQLSGAIARRLKQKNVSEAHVAVQIETFRPISIYGNVANPGQYPYVNNMTTETAIEMAGGLKAGADKSAVTLRNGAQGGRRPSALSSPVQPGDTVTVTEGR